MRKHKIIHENKHKVLKHCGDCTPQRVVLGRMTDLFADPSGDRNVNGSSCGEHEEVSKVHGKLLISFGSDDLGQMVDLDNEY